MTQRSSSGFNRFAPHRPPSVLGGLLALGAVFASAAILVMSDWASSGISRYLYLVVDLPAFVATFGCALGLALIAWALPGAKLYELAVAGWINPASLALLALVLSAIGVNVVYHGYALSMDEWMTRLQARIFLSGDLAAVVSGEWRPYGRAMYDNFAAFDPASGVLASNYRPGMAALFAVFELFKLGIYSSAFLNASAILLVAKVAQRLFPGEPSAPVVASLLLATSQQALAASLTSYAMSAHLTFNLLWLLLFLHNTPRSHIAASLVGVATAALHQVHMHLFFAMPFLLSLLRPFRANILLIYILIYAVGHVLILSWDWVSFNRLVTDAAAKVAPLVAEAPATAAPPQLEAPLLQPGVLERVMWMFQPPGGSELATSYVNIVRLIAWQNLALLTLLWLGLRHTASNRFQRLLVWSILFSTVPYPFLIPDQGHGWGYRYLHGLLGHLALLAVAGWLVLRGFSGAATLKRWVVLCLLASPLFLIPMRAYQIEAQVAPYAEATALVAQQEADIVIVANTDVFIGQDIPRNAPVDLSRPIGMNEAHLTPDQIRLLCDGYSVVFLGPEDFEPFGVRRVDRIEEHDRPLHLARRAAIEECGA